MARFERRQVLGNIANPAESQARATMRLADNLQQFGQFGMERYARARVESAQAEAKAVEPGTDAPELRSTQTMTGRAYNEIVRAGHAAAVKNDYSRYIKELEMEHSDDPVSFQTKADAYKAEMLNGVSPEIRNQVSLDFDQAVIAPFARTKQNHENKTVTESVNGMINSVNVIMDDAAKAARDGDLLGVEYNTTAVNAIAETLDEMGRFSEAQDVRSKLDQRIDKQIALGQADKAISAGKGAQYIQGFIDNPPEDLTPEQVDSYAATMIAMNNRHKSLQAQQKAAVSIETMRGISNLKIAAKNGLGDPEELMSQTEEYFNQKLISESERTSIINNIITADKEAADKAANYESIAMRLAGEDSVVVDHAVQDEYWEDIVSKQVAASDPIQGEMITVNYVNRMKRVPAGLKAQLKTYIMSDNIDLMTQALNLVDKIDETPGLVDSTFNPQEAAFIKNAVDLSQNMEPREAINLARQLTDPTNTARIEAREQEITDMQKKSIGGLNYRDEVDDLFPTWFGTNVDDVHGDQIAREYKAVFESHYKAGLSEDDAKAQAEKKVKRNWSMWNNQVIKYSPDDYYQVAGSTEYVLDQLYSDVQKEFLMEDSPKKKELVLISVEATGRMATVGKPAYRVGVKRNGSLEILGGYLWQPDMDKQIKRVEKQNKKLTESAAETVTVDLPSMESL